MVCSCSPCGPARNRRASHSLPSCGISWNRKIHILTTTQAHRVITQVVFTGARVLGRAFAEAYKQASASSAYQRAQQKAGNTSFVSGGNQITLDEACKILNVKPPKGGETNMEEVMERFKKLFDVNDPKKGGSFYLQSKVLRARERIEAEVRKAEELKSREEELKQGWKPKVFKDR
jgi:import inner membrane translocase subunit TIM16